MPPNEEEHVVKVGRSLSSGVGARRVRSTRRRPNDPPVMPRVLAFTMAAAAALAFQPDDWEAAWRANMVGHVVFGQQWGVAQWLEAMAASALVPVLPVTDQVIGADVGGPVARGSYPDGWQDAPHCGEAGIFCRCLPAAWGAGAGKDVAARGALAAGGLSAGTLCH